MICLEVEPREVRPVSVCLLSYTRPHNMQTIVDSLHHYPFVDEVLVWNNNPDVALDLHGSKVRVIPADEDMLCLGRYLCARQARNEVIYVQDDDVLVWNVVELYERFVDDSSCIAHGLSARHYARLERYRYAGGQRALVGWGAFFQKEWLAVLDAYRESEGDTPLLRREADAIFSLLLGRRHNVLPAEFEPLADGATPGIALWRDGDHRAMRPLAVRSALAYLRGSRGVPFPVTWNVVVTCWDYGRFLREAVESIVLNDADYVVTIVDDASTDDTPRVASELCERYPWVRYLRLEENVGVSRARNLGIAAQDSVFVAIVDADDRIGPDYLHAAEELLRSGWDVANPDLILFDAGKGRMTSPETVTVDMLLQRDCMYGAAAFRRSYWAQVGGFDETVEHWEDYDFWIRVAAGGARIRRLPGDHYYYRKHGPSKSSEARQHHHQLRAYVRRMRDELAAGESPTSL